MTRLLVDDGLYFCQHLVELADADAKISLVAFRVVAQLLHCTRVVFLLSASEQCRAHPKAPAQQL